MADYFRVQLNSLYLTEDGLVVDEPTNLACRVVVDGLEGLELEQVGQITKAITGNPWKFIQENIGAGVDLVLRVDQMKTSLYEDILTEINTANSSDTPLNLKLTDGELADKDLDCIPGEPAITPGKAQDGSQFSDDRIYNVEIRLTVVSIN